MPAHTPHIDDSRQAPHRPAILRNGARHVGIDRRLILRRDILGKQARELNVRAACRLFVLPCSRPRPA
jgi:hypothetical protein